MRLDKCDEETMATIRDLGWEDLDLDPVSALDDSWRPDKSRLDDVDKKLLDDVDQFGWHHLHLHPVAELRWSFTVGLFKTWGHPEVAVFGVDYEPSHELLTTVARAAKAGHNVADGSYDDQILDGFEVRFLPVRRHWYSGFFGYAQWFNETAEQFPFLQLVWPDNQSRYPWQPECSLRPGTQLLLGPSPSLEEDQ